MTTDPKEVVTAFCAPRATPDPEEILGWFTEDAVYHDIPMPPAEGRAAIEEFLGAVRDGRIAAWRDYFDLATVTAAFSWLEPHPLPVSRATPAPFASLAARVVTRRGACSYPVVGRYRQPPHAMAVSVADAQPADPAS